jgi:Rrf2 family iron-sulfur cluster assembly transcriptional regulator
MMSLNNTTGHAVRALACLAGCANLPANINDVAECADVPKAYLAKIVKQLNDAGLVASKRGSKGGIWLARPAKLISILDIAIAIEGKDFLGACLLGLGSCSEKKECPTHKFWIKNRELIRKELERNKLSDVLDFYDERGAHQMSG